MSRNKKRPSQPSTPAPDGLRSVPVGTPVGLKREQEVEKGLSAIYRDESGQLPDLTKFDQARSRWWVYALGGAGALVVLLVLAAWAGFSFLKPFRGFSGEGLTITVEGPERVSLGQDTTYFINYQNKSAEPLAAAELRVSFPSDFVIAEEEPKPNGNGLAWRLGSIALDGRGTIKVHGTFTGALGTVTAIQVVGTYRPASFNSDFEVLSSKTLTYADSVLVGTLDVPTKVLPGDHVTLVYRVENKGDTPLQRMEVRFTLPDGFERDAASSGSSLDGRQVGVPIGTLQSGASTTVTVTGSFASGVSGEAHVIAQTGHVSSEGSFLASQRSETSFTVLAGDLSLKLVMNGGDTDTVVPFGSALHFAVSYENTANEELKDVQLRLRLEPVNASSTSLALLKQVHVPVDWASYEDSVSGTRKGDTVTWNSSSIAALKRLPPHEEGSIEFSLNTLASVSGTQDVVFRAVLEADVVSVGTTKVNRVVRASPIVIRYLTDASITSEARWYTEEGAPLGSGPLPPQVGQPTVYRVKWDVAKRFHELKDMKVTAVLPKIATWPGKVTVDAGDVSYDPATRNVIWTLNRMPADVSAASAQFDIQITPTEADANRFAQLFGETRFTATDTQVNQSVVLTQPALTTDLENDDGARGKGVVRKP